MPVYPLNPSGGGGGLSDLTDAMQVANPNQGAIDMTIAGATPLYTVPAGKVFIFEQLYTEIVSVNSPNFDGNYNLGYTAPDYDDFASFLNLTLTTNVGDIAKQTVFPMGSVGLSAGQTLYYNQSSADSGTELTVKVFALGILLDA